jgi:hypothetical protein
MCPMSESKPRSTRPRPSTPQAALDALLAEPAGGPIRRALWLDELDRRLNPHLPHPLAAHARLANFDNGRLVFVVDTPVWRAKLRLAAPELLNVARSIGLDATEVVVKTTTAPLAASSQPIRKATPMSAAAQQALQAALASLKDPGSSDPEDAT